MSRTLEAIFRRPIRLVLMLLLFPIVGLAIAFVIPRTYTSTSTLYAFRRYEVISSTGTESNINATEAETQATALHEFLQSRSFALSVANGTDLPSTISISDKNAKDDALAKEITTKVIVTTQGTYTYTISYSNLDPKIAQQVVQSVIDQFGKQSREFSVTEANRRIDADQAALPQAQQDAQQKAQLAFNYQTQHPELTAADLDNDPQYLLLKQQADQAKARVQSLQSEIANLKQQVNLQTTGQGEDNSSLFKVTDPPEYPDKPESLMKQLIIGGGGGLGIALLAIVIYLVILIRRDRAVYTTKDIEKITTLPIALQIPQLDKSTLSLLISKATAGPRSPHMYNNS